MRKNKRRKASSAAGASSTGLVASALRPAGEPQPYCYEGESLTRLLTLFKGVIESARDSDPILPYKFWIKQRFAVGVNEVTRILERMPPHGGIKHSSEKQSGSSLQAIVLASDCNPRLLGKHLPALASSRGVGVILITDRQEGSLRLGELIKLKTAIAIGIKANGNTINRLVDELLVSNTVEA